MIIRIFLIIAVGVFTTVGCLTDCSAQNPNDSFRKPPHPPHHFAAPPFGVVPQPVTTSQASMDQASVCKPAPGRWNHLRKDIYSQEIIEKLEALQYRTRKTEIGLHAQIAAAELDLQQEISREDPDTGRLEKVMERLNSARGDLFRLHVLAQAEAKRIVSKAGVEQ